MISWAKGSKSSLYWLMRPACCRSRSSISTAFSLQFTRNCRKSVTRSDASEPRPMCSFKSSMTRTVGPSSINRYSLRITSSSTASVQSRFASSEEEALPCDLGSRPASCCSTASPVRAACKAFASATNSRALCSLPISKLVFARIFAIIEANSRRVWDVEKLRWKSTASRGWPSVAAQARLHSSSHPSAWVRRPSLRHTAPSCCRSTQCSHGSGWSATAT
mmetsp:Transcript_64393/g.151274  ORF Transcript_64393/g.151274 Transcript_64393/m.151274 type:complete len:220 (-) Transcript_64393:295-954(-)